MIGVRGVLCFIHLDVHIAFLLSLEVARVYSWERHGFWFCGPHILPCLVNMALGVFRGLWVVAVNVFDCEEGTANVISGTYGLHPRGFYWVPTDIVHTIDSLGNGWELVHIFGHPSFSLFAVERGIYTVGVVGWLSLVPGSVDGVPDVVLLLFAFGGGDCS